MWKLNTCHFQKEIVWPGPGQNDKIIGAFWESDKCIYSVSKIEFSLLKFGNSSLLNYFSFANIILDTLFIFSIFSDFFLSEHVALWRFFCLFFRIFGFSSVVNYLDKMVVLVVDKMTGLFGQNGCGPGQNGCGRGQNGCGHGQNILTKKCLACCVSKLNLPHFITGQKVLTNQNSQHNAKI